VSGKRDFETVAERTRLRIQKLIADTAGEAGELDDPQVAALVWAQLSGAITAVANGFAGLVSRRVPAGTDIATMTQALHDQFDSAFAQAILMRARSND
jgi:hypothetical protein